MSRRGIGTYRRKVFQVIVGVIRPAVEATPGINVCDTDAAGDVTEGSSGLTVLAEGLISH